MIRTDRQTDRQGMCDKTSYKTSPSEGRECGNIKLARRQLRCEG